MLELLIIVCIHLHLLRVRSRNMETLNEPLLRPQPERRRRRPRARQRILHTPRISHTSSIISPALVQTLHQHFPARYQSTDWQCVYSTMTHGISLHTFFKNCMGAGPVLMVIRDSGGFVFGHYSTVGWKISSQYFGTGESFVFSLIPETRVYKWTRMNQYHQLASNSIAVGGGGKFAIFIDEMLERGSSGFCQTYGSSCLASGEEFEIVVMEVYKLVPPYKLKMDGS